MFKDRQARGEVSTLTSDTANLGLHPYKALLDIHIKQGLDWKSLSFIIQNTHTSTI